MTAQCPEVIGSLAFGLHMKRLPDMEIPVPEVENMGNTWDLLLPKLLDGSIPV